MTEPQISESLTDAIEVDGTPDPDVMKRVADALKSSEDGPASTIVLSESASDTPLAARRR